MATYLIYAADDRHRRPDFGAAVATAGSAQAARDAVCALVGGAPGSLDDWAAVDLASAPECVIDRGPVGSRAQSTWPSLDRGGSPLAGS